MARNDVLKHSMPSFFSLQQEMTCCCILWHCISCCSMVHHAMALFAVLQPCLLSYLPQGFGEKTINLCGIGHHSGIMAVVLALLVAVFFV